MLLAYAEALEEGRLAEAWALSDPSAAGDRTAFEARYADAADRRARAAELRASADALRTASGAELVRGDGGWKVIDAPTTKAREVLQRFVSAAEGGDFPAAYALLSAEWRARYTPDSLQRDFQAEPNARDRLVRARAALQSSPRFEGGAVVFPVGDDKSVKLVREADGFRVAALE